MPKKYYKDQYPFAIQELLKGRSYYSVSSELGMHRSTLQKHINKYHRDILPRRTSGAKRESAKIVIPSRKTDLAYLAGIIDGEGTISKVTDTNRWALYVTNTDYSLMKWLEPIGGLMGLRERVNERSKPVYVWRIYRQADIKLLLEHVVEFMIIKKKKAYMAIKEIDKYANTS